VIVVEKRKTTNKQSTVRDTKCNEQERRQKKHSSALSTIAEAFSLRFMNPKSQSRCRKQAGRHPHPDSVNRDVHERTMKEVDDNWSVYSFLLGFSSLANHGGYGIPSGAQYVKLQKYFSHLLSVQLFAASFTSISKLCKYSRPKLFS
jgi:hypothetical protein